VILFFDTETTGLPDFRSPADDPRQPHLVQLAALLTEEDGTERATLSILVQPPEAGIPAEAAAVHGITTETAARCGFSNARAVAMWDELAGRAALLVAHNIRFDLAVMATAWRRVLSTRRPDMKAEHGERARFCTMDAAAPIVNLPPTPRMLAAGFSRPKAPKLEECIRHFFSEELAGAHDALADVRACARVFFHLRQIGAVE
jgi:DNA polymerase-3 subunit epsilon